MGEQFISFPILPMVTDITARARVERSTYQNTSDLIRAILRDEIRREAPDLYQRFTSGDATDPEGVE